MNFICEVIFRNRALTLKIRPVRSLIPLVNNEFNLLYCQLAIGIFY